MVSLRNGVLSIESSNPKYDNFVQSAPEADPSFGRNDQLRFSQLGELALTT